jgi:hypothetical protein
MVNGFGVSTGPAWWSGSRPPATATKPLRAPEPAVRPRLAAFSQSGSGCGIRKSQLNRRRKTDWLDLKPICELLMRGEGSPCLLADSHAAALRPLWNGRKDLVDARVALRLQALALVDCLWPGLTARDESCGIRPPLRGLFKTKAGRVLLDMLARGWTPQQIADLDIPELKAVFAEHGCQLKVTVATRIIVAGRSCLPPHPAAICTAAAKKLKARVAPNEIDSRGPGSTPPAPLTIPHLGGSASASQRLRRVGRVSASLGELVKVARPVSTGAFAVRPRRRQHVHQPGARPGVAGPFSISRRRHW